MDKEETRTAISHPLPDGLGKYAVMSCWLRDIIVGMRDAGEFPYNSKVEARAASILGDLSGDEKKRLGTLVYNAQKYASHAILRRSGYVPATQEALAAFDGKTVEAVQNGEMGGPRTVKVKKAPDGRFRLMIPRSRTKCLAEYADNWVRPIQMGGENKDMKQETCQQPAMLFRSALLTTVVARMLAGETDYNGAEHDELMIKKALLARSACLDEVRSKAPCLLGKPEFVALAKEESALKNALMARSGHRR